MNMEEQFQQFLDQQSQSAAPTSLNSNPFAQRGASGNPFSIFPRSNKLSAGAPTPSPFSKWLIAGLLCLGFAAIVYWVYKRFFCKPAPQALEEDREAIQPLYPTQPPLPGGHDLSGEYPEDGFQPEEDQPLSEDDESEQEPGTEDKSNQDPNFTRWSSCRGSNRNMFVQCF